MTVVSGIVGAVAGNKAGKTQANAANRATDVQERIYNQQREDFAPFRTAGNNALAGLEFESGLRTRPTFNNDEDSFDAAYYLANNSDVAASGYGVSPEAALAHFRRHGMTEGRRGNSSAVGYRGFEATPGYDFRVGEGEKAITRQAAALGGAQSGATMKALKRFGQNIASDEYQNYLSGLRSLAGVGQAATSGTAAAGSNFASGAAATIQNAGAARASGYQGVGAGIQNSLRGVGQIAGFGLGGGFPRMGATPGGLY